MAESRIGILGGTFDPIHQGHLGLAIEAVDKFGLETIFLVPSFLSPHKADREVTSIDFRVQMARLAVEPYSNIKISTVEAERGGISYTIDTINFFSNQFDGDEIFFLAGMDSFLDMGSWRDFKRIFELANIAIAVRPGVRTPDIMDCLQSWFEGDNPYVKVDSNQFLEKFVRTDKGKQITFFEPKPCLAASNEIRAMIAKGRQVKNLLPAKVENYIIDHRLYQATPPA